MSALRHWVACKLGRHFWVEYEQDVDDYATFVWCIHCGAEE